MAILLNLNLVKPISARNTARGDISNEIFLFVCVSIQRGCGFFETVVL